MAHTRAGSRTALVPRIGFLVALSAVALAPLASTAWAFGVSGIGAKAGIVDPESGIDITLQVGGFVELEQPGSRVHLLPSVFYWSSDNFSDVNPTFDVYYHFRPEGQVTPYVGGGLGVHFVHVDGIDESETDLGADLIGGVRFPGERMHFFLEGRYAATDISQVSALGGVTFHLAR